MAYWKISGDPRTVGCTSALVGDLVEDRETSTTYVRIGTGSLDFTPATSAFTSPTSPTGTLNIVEEADGSPSYTTSITTLRFDQADGFVLTNPVAGVVRVDLTAIPEANVANLTTDLAGKAATSHTHAESDVTGLVSDLAGKASSSHTHAESDVTNLTTDLAAKAPVGSSFITVASDATLTAERVLTGSTAISVTDGGANSTVTLDVNALGIATGQLQAGAVTLAKMANLATASVIGRSTAGTGVPEAMSVASPLTSASTTLGFDQTVALSNNARVAVSKGGSAVGTRRGLNLIEGANITLTVADNSGSERVDVTVSAGASSLDINGLTAETRPGVLSDASPFYDTSATANRKGTLYDYIYNGRNIVEMHDHFWHTTVASSVWKTTGVTTWVTGTAAHPGIIQGAQTGHNLNSQNADCILLGGGKWRFGVWVNTSALSTGLATYNIWAGLLDSTTAPGSDYVCFHYSHGSSAGNWELITNNAGAGTVRDTGIAVAANTWVFLEAEINAAGTSVQAYVNGTAAGAAVTTTIPTGTGRETGFGMVCSNPVGTPAGNVKYDYFGLVCELT